ncbi:T9SS type A sorting domain-containing protein [Sandaracinomonas limnophila]|uniref:T9SS type A sorting domain-containing protein n=1 Tax=Sandaracinomonas limnophila TaxID=1862386 RepID=A0A437PW68_9BACT|nr:T9SS type A sorting domain-containing protein [Sandaracinomonas limnophila]
MVEYVKIEYPSLKKIYLPQINATSGNEVNQEILRNDQRNVTSVDGFIKGFATIGTSGFDGVHYNTQGYNQSGLELYRILAEDFYGRPHNQLNYSPNITQIQYLNNQKTKFFIEFDKGQKIITPKDTLLKDKNGLDVLKKPFDSFYFKDSGFPTESSKEENIKKIYGKNNYLYFELNSAPTKDILTYLPAYSSEINLIPICSGPFIKNELGMRAFSFVNEKIKNYLPIKENDLDGDLIPDDVDDCPSIVNPTISDIIVENDFTLTINSTLKSIWYLNGIPIEGENKNKLITYKPGEYSVQLISDNGCSSLKSKTYNKIILGKKEEVEFDVFPNPISNQFLIRNRTSSDLLEKVIIYDILGKEVLNIHSISGDLLINAENWPTGKYFLNGYTSTEKKYHFQIIKE